MVELKKVDKGVFRTNSGGVIADSKNDPDWFTKVLGHAYRKVSTNIHTVSEISTSWFDLSKSAIKRDLFNM